MHDLPRWKRDLLERCSTLVSNATRSLLALMGRQLTITKDVADDTKIASADLACTVDAERAARIMALLAQVKVREDTGEVLPFSNAYRFIGCEPIPGTSQFRAVARLACGEWKERKGKKGAVRLVHVLSKINVTTGLQQLLGTYVASSLLQSIPAALRSGVCQEVGQQVMSYIGQLNSSRVRGEVAFPTVEDRDPVRRRAAYEQAIDVLTRDLTPFAYARVRDMFPGKYAEGDPHGDRMIVNDERWFAVTTTPEPHPIPLFVVQGDAVRLVEGAASFPAGASKRNRHRGNRNDDPRVRASRPEQVRRKGNTDLRQWYAMVPVLDADDAQLRRIVAEKADTRGRGLDLQFRPLPISGAQSLRIRGRDMLVQLSGDRGRLARVLRNPNLRIAWSRIVRKGAEWVLQLTVRVPIVAAANDHNVLGVSFGVDAVATWVLVGADGVEVRTGAFAPNEQILAFLREKRQLEWDQAKGRWIGGKRFARQLEAIAHGVVNDLLVLAEEHRAVLALEDVSWVQKVGPNHQQNVLFTAWNFGQLRRIASYKSQLVGRGDPVAVSDYVVSYTCPHCGACRSAKQKPEQATTWRDGDALTCRACDWHGVLTSTDRARRVVVQGREFLQTRWQHIASDTQ
ncbi:MAG: hypothetical protein Q7S96_01640 [bacterium]|nr:hypothetical protein [bacterium]